MTFKSWQNLAMAATITSYTIFILFVITADFCGHLGFDYCAFWSAGKIMLEENTANIYNPARLWSIQMNLYPQANISGLSFSAIPLPYLPIFLLPFNPLALLSAPVSFALWSLINIVGLILYLRFFAKKTMGESPPARLILMLTLSLPVFVNLYQGQLNLWLMICAGEFMRGMLAEKPFKAGVWLGGWLLKPQLLIVILPFLLFRRELKALAGFAVSALTILGASFALVGIEGMLALKDIWLGSSAGGQASNAGVMMNWRMLGENIRQLTTPTVGWIVIVLGSLFTIALTLSFFRYKKEWNENYFVSSLLGLFAATCATTWHAHVHMAIILIPPLIYCIMRGLFNQKIISLWIFLPITFQLIGYVMVRINFFENPYERTNFVYLMSGLGQFTSNLILISYAASVRPPFKNEKSIVNKTN